MIIRRQMFFSGVLMGIVFGAILVLSKNQIEAMAMGVLTSVLIGFLFIASEEKKDCIIMGLPIPIVAITISSLFYPGKESLEKIFLYGKFFAISLIICFLLIYLKKSREQKIPE